MEAADQQATKMEKPTINAFGKGKTLHETTQSAEGKPQSKYKLSAFSQQSKKHAIQLTYRHGGHVGHYGKMCTVALGKHYRFCSKERHFGAVCHTKAGLKVNQMTSKVPHNVSLDIMGEDDDPEWVFVLKGDTNYAEM